MDRSSSDTAGLRAALWSALDNGVGPAGLAAATDNYLTACGGRATERPAVLVAAAHRLEVAGRRLAEAGQAEDAVSILGVALRAAGEADHLVLTTSLLGLREELLVDLGRNSDPLQRRFARLVANADGHERATQSPHLLREENGAEPDQLFDAAPVQQPASPDRMDIGIGRSAGIASLARQGPPRDEEPEGGPDPRAHLAVLRRQRWVVLLTTLVMVGLALGYSLSQMPVYESTAQILVYGESVSGPNQALQQIAPGDQQLETFSQLVESETVAATAAEKLQGDASPNQLLEQVSATRVGQTQLLEVSATSPDRQRAVAVAQAFAEAFLDYRADQALDQVARANEALQRREEELRNRLAEIEEELANATGPKPELEGEQQRLENELTGLAAQQASLSGSEALARGGGEVVRAASVPESPISPNPLRTGIEALVFGLLLGVGLGFLREFLDDSVRSGQQAKRITGASPVGYIPTWEAGERDRRRLVTLMDPASPVAEAYRTLRTNVRYLIAGRQVSSLLVSSARPQEGKTTTAGNLAVALADAGLQVLLVDADLRNPMVHETVGIDQAPGLMELLVGDAQRVEDVAAEVVEGLHVIPAGTVPPNPAELLGSRGMFELVGRFEDRADVVVYDSAPLLAVADTLELAQLVELALLVVDVGGSGQRSLEETTERLRGVGAPLGGLVLNNVEIEESRYGDYYYSNYYSAYQQGE